MFYSASYNQDHVCPFLKFNWHLLTLPASKSVYPSVLRWISLCMTALVRGPGSLIFKTWHQNITYVQDIWTFSAKINLCCKMYTMTSHHLCLKATFLRWNPPKHKKIQITCQLHHQHQNADFPPSKREALDKYAQHTNNDDALLWNKCTRGWVLGTHEQGQDGKQNKDECNNTAIIYHFIIIKWPLHGSEWETEGDTGFQLCHCHCATSPAGWERPTSAQWDI